MSNLSDLRPRPTDVPSELFVAPSREAQFLVRHLAWLVAPTDGRGGLVSRALRMALVAPFTQLTFVSFDLQAFLFDIFHTTRIARLGHFAFMASFNFCLMAGLARLGSGTAIAYTAVLCAWYGLIAWSARLPLWWFVMLPVLAAMCWGAIAFATLAAPWANPWLGAALSAVLIMLSHAPEPALPPRAIAGNRWQPLNVYVFGPRDGLQRLRNAGRLALFLFWGTLDEAWAAPRLLPYNVLMLLLRLGYAPELRDRLRDRVARAQRDGNPALDYVGTGGGTFLALQSAATQADRN